MDKACLIPDCISQIAHLRGLCRSCYTFAASLVRLHITTWEQLEANGSVGPAGGATQSPKRPLRVEWFAKGVGLPPDLLQSEVRRRTIEHKQYKQSRRLPRRKS